jgi:hypothetical protein
MSPVDYAGRLARPLLKSSTRAASRHHNQLMRVLRAVACVVAAFVAMAGAPRGADIEADRMWFAPAPGSSDYLRLFQAPAEWPRGLRVLDVFQFYQQHTDPRPNSVNGPNTYTALVRAGAFRTVTRTWRKKIALEVGAVKEFYCTPDAAGMQEAIDATLASVRAVELAGGRVSYLAMDEPFLSGLSVRCGGPSLVPTADRLAVYMNAVSQAVPGVRIGLIEAYPSFNPDRFAEMIRLMRERRVPPAFLHVDVDLAAIRPGRDDFSRDVTQLADLSAGQRVVFGVIIWGGDGNANSLYAVDAMKLEQSVESAFPAPDVVPPHIIVQSWAESATGLRITPANLPEDRPDTHTELLMRVFLRLFATRSRSHTQGP